MENVIDNTGKKYIIHFMGLPVDFFLGSPSGVLGPILSRKNLITFKSTILDQVYKIVETFYFVVTP